MPTTIIQVCKPIRLWYLGFRLVYFESCSIVISEMFRLKPGFISILCLVLSPYLRDFICCSSIDITSEITMITLHIYSEISSEVIIRYRQSCVQQSLKRKVISILVHFEWGGTLMQIKSNAESSYGSFLHYYWSAISCYLFSEPSSFFKEWLFITGLASHY